LGLFVRAYCMQRRIAAFKGGGQRFGWWTDTESRSCGTDAGRWSWLPPSIATAPSLKISVSKPKHSTPWH